MGKKRREHRLSLWLRRKRQDVQKWCSGIKAWQWILLVLIAVLCIWGCIWGLPLLGRLSLGDSSGFWDGLDRFGGVTGLITVVFAVLGFWNTKRILDYRTSDYRALEEDNSNEAFDLFVRVSSKVTSTASMDDFLRHCQSCCPLKNRSWPRAWQDGKEIHLARLFQDNNEKGFQSSFHRELFERFGGDGERVKQRFMELLRPVVIHYGEAAIREQRTAAVYFLPEAPEAAEQQVMGERIMEVHFPMDLPSDDPERRQAFLAYFAAVMQLLFQYFHNTRLCYLGPTMLPGIMGSIADNEHVLENYQYDSKTNCYYRVGSSDHKTLIASFLDTIR